MFLLSIHILAFLLQAAVLDFVFIDLCGWPCWTFAALDGILLINMILSYRLQGTAVKGATQWMCYSWLLCLKLGVLYFMILTSKPESLSTTHKEEVLAISRSYAFFILVYLTPIMYAFWMGRGAQELFKDAAKKVTVESLIYCDIALHVMFDLLDCVTALRYAALMYGTVNLHPKLYNANGVILLLGICLHSFSIPSYCSSTSADGGRAIRSAEVQSIQRNDIYLTRKHVALVSMFAIDIPLIVVRFAYSYYQDEKLGLQIFLVKNILNLPLSTYRLSACRTAEKESFRASDKQTENLTSVKTNMKLLHEAATTKNKAQESAEALLNPPEEIGGPDDTMIAEEDEDSEIEDFDVEECLGEVESKSVLPVKGFAMRKVIAKFWQCLSSGGRHTTAERLDTGLKLSYWKQLRLSLALVTFWSTRLVITALFATGDLNRTISVGEDGYKQAKPILLLIATTTCLIFLSNVGAVDVFDSLFTCWYWAIRNLSFYVTADIFITKGFFDLRRFLANFGFYRLPPDIQWERLTVLVIGLHPIVSLLTGLFYAQSSCLSRKFSFYAMQPRNRAAQQIADASTTEASAQLTTRSDEYGWISTAAILCFLNCKHHLAPLNMHQLLMGPDIIKSTRLCDIMLVHDWCHMIATGLLRVIACLLVKNKWTLLVLLAHFLTSVCYIVSSQTIRLLSIRKFHMKCLYVELCNLWHGTSSKDDALTDDGEVEEPMSKIAAGGDIGAEKTRDLLDLLARYQREAFLTSPGEILPPLRI